MRSAIVGAGMSHLSADSGQSELSLAVTACRAALEDANLEPADVDGFVTYSGDRTGIARLQRALGVPELRLYAEIPYGGAASCGTVALAAAAIAGGEARCVVCYRALNGRSGVRLGRAERHLGSEQGRVIARGDAIPGGVFAAPSGLLAPAQAMALWARRYAAVYGLDDDTLSEALGAIAVVQRDYAQRNPRAVTRGRDLTLEQYLSSRLIADPLRIYDLCRETDGAAALVLTREPHAPSRAVRVLAGSQNMVAYSEPVPVFTDDLTHLTREDTVGALFKAATVSAEEIDVAIIYDATTIGVLLTLEDFGFCDRGAAPDFLAAREHAQGGRLPVNPHGGLLSEGYVHGLNSVVEAVRQLRGEADNQVADAQLALVAARGAALILAGGG